MVLVSLSHFLVCANLWVRWVGLGYLTPQSELDKRLKFTSPWTQQSVVSELDLSAAFEMLASSGPFLLKSDIK